MIAKSDSIEALASALHQAQGEMPVVQMDSSSYFGKFASLGAMIETTRPVLADHGLSVSQFATSENGAVGVTTVLMHVSGEWMASTITLPLMEEGGKSLAQVAGSVITYLRRYSLSAVLGLYSDEDVDGEPATRAQSTAKRPAATRSDEPRNMSELYAMVKAKFEKEKDEAVQFLKEKTGCPKVVDAMKNGWTVADFWILFQNPEMEVDMPPSLSE